MYFPLNLLACSLVFAFSTTLIAKTWKLGCPRITAFSSTFIAYWGLVWPRIVSFLSTLIAWNWNLIKQPFSYIFAFHNAFFYTQLAFAFYFMTGFLSLLSILTVFAFFFSRTVSIPFVSILTLSSFLFFRMILIPSAFLWINW